MEVQKETLVT